ncbi:hypothetical protein V8F20_004628 [Naviculisporaceae sp. PSN 640]
MYLNRTRPRCTYLTCTDAASRPLSSYKQTEELWRSNEQTASLLYVWVTVGTYIRQEEKNIRDGCLVYISGWTYSLLYTHTLPIGTLLNPRLPGLGGMYLGSPAAPSRGGALRVCAVWDIWVWSKTNREATGERLGVDSKPGPSTPGPGPELEGLGSTCAECLGKPQHLLKLGYPARTQEASFFLLSKLLQSTYLPCVSACILQRAALKSPIN